MKPRDLGSTALRLSLLVLVLAGCFHNQRRVGPDPVPNGEWCRTVGRTRCNWIIDSCTSGEAEWVDGTYSCEESHERSCLGSRNRARSSGRTYDELARCAEHIETLSCRELGVTPTSAEGQFGIAESGAPPAQTQALCDLPPG
ncbi:MAG: hypothetical protein M3Y87_24850 [Myxococcota bacterium]|nr:hypothetical protein [Myxococcota bacterium]